MRQRHNTANMPTSVIRLKVPPTPVKEIRDFDCFEFDSCCSTDGSPSDSLRHSPVSLNSDTTPAMFDFTNPKVVASTNNQWQQLHHHHHQQQQQQQQQQLQNQLYPLPYDYNKTTTCTVCNDSGVSSLMSPRSSVTTSSLKSDNSSTVNTYQNAADEEPFTFQDFVCSIVNSNEKEWHVLIIQDIARLLELKFREFKSSVTKSGHLSSFTNNASIFLDSSSDLFVQVAESLFRSAMEEPNGILGTKLKLRLLTECGKLVDVCQLFPYDASTLATSEITITLKEDKTRLKKLLQSFRFASSLAKYLTFSIDTRNFDMNKKKLY